MKNLNEIIGNTSLCKLKLNDNIFWLKLEGENPSGSIKDRLVYHLIKEAKKKKELSLNQPLIEISSGNTGVALSFIGSKLNHPVEIIFPNYIDKNIVNKVLSFKGKPLILDPNQEFKDAMQIIKEKIQAGYYWPNQYQNKSSVESYKELSKEIVEDIFSLDYLIAAVGTGGTIMGLGSKLKLFYPSLSINAIESYYDEKIEGIRNSEEFHLGENDIYKKEFPSKIIRIKNQEAYLGSNILEKQGFTASLSSGAIFYATLNISKLIKNKNLLLILADGRKKNGN
ncbi:MAG: pyridoxal-phosphate dependent enzyme [Nanoarchaeota archaeon]|nr:pyridoxal-phosphate dependent enzyme [Nanoarchaeota archaeon]